MRDLPKYTALKLLYENETITTHHSQQQYGQAQHENFNVSPFSAAMALSLLSQVANGTTFHELQRALNLNPDKATVATQVHDYLELLSKNAYGSQVLIANRIYVPKWFQLRKSFQNVASEKFSSGVESVDFEKSNETADAINQFVKNATDGKIGKVIRPEDLDGQNGAILVNALTLKSKWSCPFSVGDTMASFFFNNNPDRAELAGVYFMRTKGSFPTLYLRELGVKMLRLNFKNSSLAFVIAMPIVASDELHTVEERVRNYTLAKLLDHMAPGECFLKHGKLRVDIPKIKIETEINLNEVLKKMGIAEIFTDNADLSGLSETNQRIKVAKIIHKVYIDLNEDHDEPVERRVTGPRFKVNANIFLVRSPYCYYVWDSLTNTTILNGRIEGFPKYMRNVISTSDDA